MNQTDVKTCVWDYDGCIHDSLKIYAPAFRKAYSDLVSAGLARPKAWSEAELKPWIGLSPPRMWQLFRPDLPARIREKSSETIGNHMLQAIKEDQAVWYSGALPVLQTLVAAGYRMVLISHCREAYLRAHQEKFQLELFFDRIIASETYHFAEKADILAQIQNEYPNPKIMIGDRATDIKAGQRHQMITVGCAYGFGNPNELADADYIIHAPRELLDLLKV